MIVKIADHLLGTGRVCFCIPSRPRRLPGGRGLFNWRTAQMAKRYRTFKRVRMTARSAQAIVETIVDRTFDDHFAMVCGQCSKPSKEKFCRHCEMITERKWKARSCQIGKCTHVESRNLDCARLIEAGAHIAKTKGYIDLPPDDPELLRLLAARIRSFVGTAGKAASAFARVADAAERHARRGWLHQLAECALDHFRDDLGRTVAYHPVEADQRCVSDQIDDAVVDRHGY